MSRRLAPRGPSARRHSFVLGRRVLGALRCSTLCAAALLAPSSALAHPAPFSYVDLHLNGRAIEGTLVVHMFDAGHDLGVDPPEHLLTPSTAAAYAEALMALVEPRLVVSADGRAVRGAWSAVEPLPDRQSLLLHVRYTLDRAPATLSVTARMFPYDPYHETFLNVHEGSELTQAILDRGNDRFDYFAGNVRGTAAVGRKLAAMGAEHILIGPDHLLFLFGLLVLGGTMAQLVWLATAFTAAHVVTLTLAALNIVMPSTRIVEPAIALSIVYMGADNLLIRGGRDVRGWIACAFGGMHGFGFANVLRGMELSRRALLWSLVSFNVGVEIGQLAVVVILAWALALLRSRSEAAGRQLAFAGSVVVIAAGAFWFVQRVFFPGGIS
jgi:hydrogenase/urease accessory protein HupE